MADPKYYNGIGAPPSQAAFNAALRADAQRKLGNLLSMRDTTPTFAEVLASERPLNEFFASSRIGDPWGRMNTLQRLHRDRFRPGAEWDETTPAGRQALMRALGWPEP